MRVLVKESHSIIADLAFDKQLVEIGSSQQCALRLPDMRVAAVHASLVPQAGGHWLLRLADVNAKTSVNGHVRGEEVRLEHGDEITIGDYTLNIYLGMGERRTEKPVERAAPEVPLPHGSRVKGRRDEVTLSPGRVQTSCEFAAALGSAQDISGVMDCTMNEMLRRERVRACWIGVRRVPNGPIDYNEGRTFKGQHFDEPKMGDMLGQRSLLGGLTVLIPTPGDPEVSSVLATPLATPEGRLGFLYADTRAGGGPFDEADLDHMMVLGSLVGARLQRVQQAQSRARQALSSAESTIVQAVQSRLDLRAVPEWDSLQLAVHSSPGDSRCGDVYDILQMSNGVAAMLVGHVGAEDVDAAISMVEIRTAFRIAVLHADMPHIVMREFNWLLSRSPKAVTMDCSIVLADPRNGAMLHCRAGRTGGVVVSPNGHVRRLDDAMRPPLGGAEAYDYTTRKGLLGKRESLVLYSPGIFEICSDSGTTLGEHTFIDSLCDSFGMAARAALNDTISELETFRGTGEQPEDVTILMAHRTD